jgi:hypothetical protein
MLTALLMFVFTLLLVIWQPCGLGSTWWTATASGAKRPMPCPGA